MQTNSMENCKDVTEVDNSNVCSLGVRLLQTQRASNSDEKSSKTQDDQELKPIEILDDGNELPEDDDFPIAIDDDDDIPDSPHPDIRELFKRLRRLRRTPPTDDVVRSLIQQGYCKADARAIVDETICLFREALKLCGDDRKLACVLAGLEYLSRRGQRLHSWREMKDFLGQNNVRRSLRVLTDLELVFYLPHGWTWLYQLIRPLQCDSSPLREQVQNPIDILRLELEELNALSRDDFKNLVIGAAKSVAHDTLLKRKIAIKAEISQVERMVADDEALSREVQTRIFSRREKIRILMREFSDICWQLQRPTGLLLDRATVLNDDYVEPAWRIEKSRNAIRDGSGKGSHGCNVWEAHSLGYQFD